MINKFSISNYKAFDFNEIPLKPITILIGANSVGKSSIIQLLLLLQQTGKEDVKSYRSALKLYGGYVNIGEAANLFRKKDTSKPIKLKFSVSNEKLYDQLHGLLARYTESIISVARYIPIKSFIELREKKISTQKDFEKLIDIYIKLLAKENTNYEKYIDEMRWLFKYRTSLHLDEINSKNKPTLIKVYTFLEQLNHSCKEPNFDYSFEIYHKDNQLLIKHFQLNNGKKTIFEFNHHNNIQKISSDFCEFSERESEEILKTFDKNSTIFNCFSDLRIEEEASSLSSVILSIISPALEYLKAEFLDNKINYVSPLRAHPKRYYMLDKAKINLTLDTLDGDAIADVLKDNPGLKKKVNSWFETFNLSVDVEEFKEVVHHLKVRQHDLSLDITDVGFGISQVLPVIIQGFLSKDGSTTIIEQPEIHLHPKMQADMADLFIDIVKNSKGKKLLVETHSEYLLKRLRRRISEGKILADDVAICLFNPQNEHSGATIKTLEIENKGFFEWPIDFYGGEILKDTTEFLKNQISD